MKRLAIIPARGGSKRIPHKNIKPFLGKPIIAYSILAAVESGLFDEVMVSTDDVEIQKIAQDFGAKVPFIRSAKNADDFATTASVIQEVLDYYKEQNLEFDQVLCIYPCAPFVTKGLLNQALLLLNQNNCDCVFPIIEFPSPIQRALILQNEKAVMKHKEFEFSRSQDLEKSYYDAGQFYFISTKSFLENQTLRPENNATIVLDEKAAQDIDDLDDWAMAEIKYNFLQNRI